MRRNFSVFHNKIGKLIAKILCQFPKTPIKSKKTTGNRRVLLDTNVWAVFADNDLSQTLVKCLRKKDLELQVAPAVVYEALRFKDETARNTRLKLMNNRAFERLMPESFSESIEVLLSIAKYNPNWIRSSPDFHRWNMFHQDWTKKVSGGRPEMNLIERQIP